MTRAICLACGDEKFGCFVECDGCGHVPSTPEEQRISVFYSDHYIRNDRFAAVQAGVRAAQAQGIPFTLTRADCWPDDNASPTQPDDPSDRS